MAFNPYAPPSAPVRDVSPQASLQTRPIAVGRACRLLWWSFGLSIPSTILKSVGRFVPAMLVGGLIGVTIGALLTYWFTRKLNAGRNWMRILLTTFTVLGILALPLLWSSTKQLYVALYGAHPAQLTISVIVVLSQYALNVIAVILINTRAARVWFRESTERARGVA